MVGYYEYSKALRYFNQLLRRSKPEDVKVYNAYVARDPSLAVFVQHATKNKAEDAAKDSDTTQKVEPQYGLFKMMALARVELGAMKAGFHGESNAFVNKSVSKLEAPAYEALLREGVQLHLNQLARNAEFHRELQGTEKKVSTKTLAYMRRLIVVNRMADALTKLQTKDATPSDVAQYRKWQSDSSQALNKLEKRMYDPMVTVVTGVDDIATTGSSCGVGVVMGRLGLRRSSLQPSRIQSPRQRSPGSRGGGE